MLYDEEFSGLSDTQLDLVDAACDRYEAAWTPESRAVIEQCLGTVDAELRAPLFRELLSTELEHLHRSGCQPPISEYLSRFPDLEKIVVQIFERHQAQLIDAETQVSRSGDTDPSSHAAPEEIEELPREFGRYRLLKLLGRGGMGSVYLAHDTDLDRQVALKMPVLGATSAVIQATIDRFKREARAMANVNHANLCPIYDVGQRDGHPYLTMAFIDGRPLSELLEAGQSFSAEEAVRIVRALAQAMEAVHRAGIVHRDLKPGNVMFNPNGEPIVMDFGLASRDAALETELTNSCVIVGSPAYMAPEQVNASRELIGPRTDIFALGVILYQLLTGRRPFEGAGLSVLGQISSGQRPAPPTKLAKVNPRLEAICLKAMAHRVEDRYQSAAELAAALEECSSNTAELHGVRPVRQISKKLLATVCGLASVILIVLLVPGIKMLLTGPASSDGNDAPVSPNAVHGQPMERAASMSPLVSADYEWSEPVNLGAGANSEWAEDHPTMTADGLTLVFMRVLDGQRLWQSTRTDVAQPFGPAVRLFEDAESHDDNCPFLSHDGLTMWFHSTRSIAPNRSDHNLWVARRRSLAEPFENPLPLGPEINTYDAESSAFVSSDGLTLLFMRWVPPGKVDQIFQATRTSESDEFSKVHPLNVDLHGTWNGFPRLSADGRSLLFASNLGGHGLWLATRDSVGASFGTPTMLDPKLNEGIVSAPFLSSDETTLYFSSTRSKILGNRDLWSSTRVRKRKAKTDQP